MIQIRIHGQQHYFSQKLTLNDKDPDTLLYLTLNASFQQSIPNSPLKFLGVARDVVGYVGMLQFRSYWCCWLFISPLYFFTISTLKITYIPALLYIETLMSGKFMVGKGAEGRKETPKNQHLKVKSFLSNHSSRITFYN